MLLTFTNSGVTPIGAYNPSEVVKTLNGIHLRGKLYSLRWWKYSRHGWRPTDAGYDTLGRPEISLSAQWGKVWVEISVELMQDRRLWGTSVRDVVNSTGAEGSTLSEWMNHRYDKYDWTQVVIRCFMRRLATPPPSIKLKPKAVNNAFVLSK